MPASKPKAVEEAPPKSTDDGGAAALQALADEATSKGYFGTVPDPHPNEAYSLKSGPESPSAASHTPAAKATTKKEG